MSEMHSSLIHKVEEFLTLKLFHCGICQQILQIPIILTENFGNICSSCYEDAQQHTNVIGLENSMLAELLKTLDLPCENESEGCIERIPYDKIHKHKIYCRYQTVECELAPKCSWKGHYKDLVEHFQDHNKKSILKSIDDTFETTIPEENVLSTQILKTVYGLFVLHIKVTGNKLHYLLFAVDDLEKQLKYHFVMKFTDESETELNFKCVPVEGSKRFMTFEEASSTVINLDIVKCNLTSGKMFVILDIDRDIYKIRKCLMNCMKCKKCSLNMTNCDEKDVECPECLNGQNSNTNEMEYPCKFKRSRYSVEFSSQPLHNSQLCYYHPWRCPVSNCGDQLFSFYSLLIKHMRTKHDVAGMCYFDRSSISRNEQPISENDIYLIIYDRIFKINHTFRNRTLRWEVFHIGPIKERFQLEIEINKNVSGEKDSLHASKEFECYTNEFAGKIEFDSQLHGMFGTNNYNYPCDGYKLKIIRLLE